MLIITVPSHNECTYKRDSLLYQCKQRDSNVLSELRKLNRNPGVEGGDHLHIVCEFPFAMHRYHIYLTSISNAYITVLQAKY